MIQATSSDLAIELVGVTKRYRRNTAVRELSLQIPKGAAFGFIGPNGAGKTTTIRMIMGLLPMTAGQGNVLGINLNSGQDQVKRYVGYVPEQHFIYRWMRVGQVVRFCRSFYETWNDKYCSELLDLFGLDGHQKVKHLSKGMVTKLALVLALAHEPELLILDEPMAGLDPLVREEIVERVLHSICERKRTVFLSSHTLSDVRRVSDVIGIIHEGQLLTVAPTEQLVSGTKRIRAVLEEGQQPKESPEGTIWNRVQGREWLITVKDFTSNTVERLRSANPLQNIEVIDLGLEEIFKDYIRGAEVAA
ncbi:MAG: ABC transporter ATP-binding protein [Planctomycetota bacterium]|nr:MAG: ABC transporter ATP-binding protein [Planctomycetota bacterium]